MPEAQQEKRRSTTLITLIIAGEAIFFLPFVLARIFRPTLLEYFDISNTELGILFSIYGIVAMVSYLFGGTLADRIPARSLMAVGLWLTSGGGFVMTLFPDPRSMKVLYAFWGFTTICLFWAAMIRATREWGGGDFQGRAFGWLEGGRGAVAALLGTLSFFLFSWLNDFKLVILTTSVLTLISGFLVWIFVPVNKLESRSKMPKAVIGEVGKLLGNRSIWMLAIIIVCAYAGYKITDDFSLYAREVLGFSEVGAAGIGTTALWIRALVAIMAGYLADRLNRVHVIMVSFALTIGGSLLIGFGILDQIVGLVLLKLALTATGIYGVRALYFSVMKEAKIPLGLTGTAVGIVSFAGFTPEVFMSPWMGYLLDRHPGTTGHQYVFLLLSLFAFIGLVSSLFFGRDAKRGATG
ncbi:MAG: MFS transporter [Bacteroidota bacterium]